MIAWAHTHDLEWGRGHRMAVCVVSDHAFSERNWNAGEQPSWRLEDGAWLLDGKRVPAPRLVPIGAKDGAA